jgi:prepilin peptidase CpaA
VLVSPFPCDGLVVCAVLYGRLSRAVSLASRTADGTFSLSWHVACCLTPDEKARRRASDSFTMNVMQSITLYVALFFMLIVCTYDLRERRIPNQLNLAGLIVGLLLQTTLGGVQGFLSGLSGFAVGFAILLLPFIAGMVGGGDVKFVAAAGSFLGWQLVLVGLGIGVVVGGVVGAISLIRRHRFGAALRSLAADLVCLSSGVRPAKLQASTAVETVPYGVSLAIGLSAGIAAALIKEVS